MEIFMIVAAVIAGWGYAQIKGDLPMQLITSGLMLGVATLVIYVMWKTNDHYGRVHNTESLQILVEELPVEKREPYEKVVRGDETGEVSVFTLNKHLKSVQEDLKSKE